jgi:hypothetical protein
MNKDYLAGKRMTALLSSELERIECCDKES